MTLFSASKRPFGHPLPASALEYFVHPRPDHYYHAPAWGRDSRLYVSNGWVAARFFNFPQSFGTGPQDVVDRLRKLPWDQSKHVKIDDPAWRKMDDCTLDLFQEGVWEPWHPELRAYRMDPCVRINNGTIVPLVSLQLVSRLPKAEIFTMRDRDEPLRWRCNGGEGFIAALTLDQAAQCGPPMCHLFEKHYNKY